MVNIMDNIRVKMVKFIFKSLKCNKNFEYSIETINSFVVPQWIPIFGLFFLKNHDGKLFPKIVWVYF